MAKLDKQALDRYITGNYGEDFFEQEKRTMILNAIIPFTVNEVNTKRGKYELLDSEGMRLCYCDSINKAKEEIAEYMEDGSWYNHTVEVKEETWISVKDKLPEYGTTVIVDGGIAYRRIQDKGKWYTITSIPYPGKLIRWEVTHWMPLLKLPE